MKDSTHVATMVERALVGSAAAAGCAVRIDAAAWTGWSSASFAGARGKLTLTAERSGILDGWLAELARAELALRGHLVAELAVRSIQTAGSDIRIELEVLTVEI